MSEELRHKKTGEPLSLVVSQYPGELDIDAVGIWQIVPGGRTDFDLSGDALDDYVRRAILALLEAGAVPVRHIAGSNYEWVYQPQYGDLPSEIAANVIAEWHSLPDDPLILISKCPWFARPDPAYPKYVKMD